MTVAPFGHALVGDESRPGERGQGSLALRESVRTFCDINITDIAGILTLEDGS